MTTKSDLVKALLDLDKSFIFHLDGKDHDILPTSSENEKWLQRYEAELETAGTDYWQTLKDLTLRKTLQRVIMSVETLEKHNQNLPSEDLLNKMVNESSGIRTFAGKLDSYADEATRNTVAV